MTLPEFQVHRLNDEGLRKADAQAELFSTLLAALDVPQGRPRSIMITKLQEAAFWAKRAIAEDAANQVPPA
jgi:hypothetical protein